MRAFPWLLSVAFAASLACSACAVRPVHAATAASGSGPAVTLRGHRFTVEIADTVAAREHGLMDRTAMPADHGMLFVFADAEPRTFWMKNTLIPLDILFFDSADRLVTIRADVPPCKTNPCPTYASTAPARYVLELNAGTAASIGARKGDLLGVSGMPSGTQ
ncbi:MAG TPA: DUF192 domain-containing protein [Rhodanobacteraceae bacterium]|nr:DUF192 domain-containing protein [Rhodanobacteraceae bacterium]